MIAALAIAFSVVAQAASVNWSLEGAQINGDWDTGDGDTATGFLICLFDNSSIAQADMITAIGSDSWKTAVGGNLASFVGGSDGTGYAYGLAVDGNTFNGYMVILDAGSIDAAQNAYVTTVYTADANSMGKIAFDTFDDEMSWVNATETGAGSGWMAVGQSVPEPTSGLLLLLGMAGLALKRKVA